MARPKKDREINIVHFSFFDLLFGAFGAFIFLMIMQVISTINMVDIDIQKLVDQTIREKSALSARLKEFQDMERRLQDLQVQYDRLLTENESLTAEAKNLRRNLTDMSEELNALREFRKKAVNRDNIIKLLEEKNSKLVQELKTANEKLAAISVIPLKIKTTALPIFITEENINVFVAAEGGTPPYNWEVIGGLPGGLSFNQETGALSGSPVKAGDYTVNVKLTDAEGLSVRSPGIDLKIIKKYEEPVEEISPWFVILAVVSLFLLFYALWVKIKYNRYAGENEQLKAENSKIKEDIKQFGDFPEKLAQMKDEIKKMNDKKRSLELDEHKRQEPMRLLEEKLAAANKQNNDQKMQIEKLKQEVKQEKMKQEAKQKEAAAPKSLSTELHFKWNTPYHDMELLLGDILKPASKIHLQGNQKQDDIVITIFAGQ